MRKSLNRSIVESLNRGDSPGVRPSPGAATSGCPNASDLPRAIRPLDDAAPGDGRTPGKATLSRSHTPALPRPTPRSAFTMVEIALCIAIIGFALVAIIGVLPTAMRVQQDNRGDTIIDQEGNYFLEAIRNGARGLDDLTNYLGLISGTHFPIRTVSRNSSDGSFVTNFLMDPKYFNTGEKLIGILSAPRTNNDDFRVEAEFRAISGAAVEKDPNSPISFAYLLTSEIVPFSSFDAASVFGPVDPNSVQNLANNLRYNLYEVRLTFRWPLSPVTGAVGNNKKVFRTLASGNLARAQLDNDWPYFFFQPANFVPLNPP